jgi:four helix bundle protein
MAVRHYQDLVAWQQAMELVQAIYRATRGFPKEEMFGLAHQIRRSAVSIPSNIAEGQARTTTREFIHFLSIGNGSRQELETQTIIAQRLGYLSSQQTEELLNASYNLGRVLSGLVRSLKARTNH